MTTSWYKQKSFEIKESMNELRSGYTESQIEEGIQIFKDRQLKAIATILKDWLEVVSTYKK